MKKFFYLTILLFLFFINSENSFADCLTGFACSIEDIEKLQAEQNEVFIKSINYYFSKNINEDIFLRKISSQIIYNDLFIFNTIV